MAHWNIPCHSDKRGALLKDLLSLQVMYLKSFSSSIEVQGRM